MRTAMIAILVLGCGGSTPAPTSPTNGEPAPTTAAAKDPTRKPTAAECSAAVDRAIKLAHTDPEFGERLGQPGAEDEMRAEGNQECVKEWTGVTLDCVMTAATVPDVENCMKTLDKDAEPQP